MRSRARRGCESPRKVSNTRRRGLLGAPCYNSESDDDYQPATECKQPSPAKARVTAASPMSDDPSARSDSVTEPSCSYDSMSSSDGETLAARQQRGLRSKGRDSAPGGSAAHRQLSQPQARCAPSNSDSRETGSTSLDQLPTAALAHIFTAVCKHGALPMAPRLACVCTSWNAAVAATPELWRVLDTAGVPNRAWSSRGSSSSKRKRNIVQQDVQSCTAERGLQHWVASGRLRLLQTLTVHGEGLAEYPGVASLTAGPAPAAPTINRQLSLGLLMQMADHCRHLKRVSLFGRFTIKAQVDVFWLLQELSDVLTSMPALSALSFFLVRVSTAAGLGACVHSVLEAAATSGGPKLQELVVDSCAGLSYKAIAALCPPRPPPPAAAAVHPASSQQQLAGESTQEATAPQHQGFASRARQPAFPCLEVLDLNQSGVSATSLRLQLNDMQAAMPHLRVLKLSGLGGCYGWQSTIRKLSPLPGFPALQSLHLDTAAECSELKTALGGELHPAVQPYRSSYVTDDVLLQLAGQSPQLRVLDLSGTLVTAVGIRQLAAAHARCRHAAASKQAPTHPGTAQPRSGAAVNIPAHATPAHDGGGGGAGEQQPHAAAASVGVHAAATSSDLGSDLLEGALRLQSLRLDGSSAACDEGLQAVGQCCYKTLEQLVVRKGGSNLADDGIRGLSTCVKLTVLNVTRSNVTEDGLKDLFSALPAGVLEELHLESCRYLSRGARQAAARSVRELQQYLAVHVTGCR